MSVLLNSVAALIICLSLFACSSARIAKVEPPFQQATSHSSEIHAELAVEFLNSVCSNRGEKAFGEAWLRYEQKHWDFYKQLYYGTPERVRNRISLAERYDSREAEVCGNVRRFLVSAPAVIEKMSVRVESLLGAHADAPIYFAVALQETDGRGDTWNGENILVLNSRHAQFARPTGLVSVVSHELIHAAQSARWKGKTNELPSFARSLYSEGAAVFGVEVLLPEIGEEATGIKGDELRRAGKVSPQAAKEALSYLDQEPPAQEMRRFFEGGWKDSVFPAKMGYYLGALIFKRMADERGNTYAIQMSPEEFRGEVKRALTSISIGGVQ